MLYDNAPGHPINLNSLPDHIRVEYVPKRIMVIIQVIYEGVISRFKAYYRRRTFAQLNHDTQGEDKRMI